MKYTEENIYGLVIKKKQTITKILGRDLKGLAQ